MKQRFVRCHVFPDSNTFVLPQRWGAWLRLRLRLSPITPGIPQYKCCVRDTAQMPRCSTLHQGKKTKKGLWTLVTRMTAHALT